jgi:hypothetical protein
MYLGRVIGIYPYFLCLLTAPPHSTHPFILILVIHPNLAKILIVKEGLLSIYLHTDILHLIFCFLTTMTLPKYHAEEHFVTTPDGYVLGLHRIPVSNLNDGADEVRNHRLRPVLILHGFMHSSEAFTIRQRTADSLPLVLNNAGYDVWLGNILRQI